MRTWYETHTVLSSTVEFPYLVPALIKLLAEHNLHPEPVQSKRYTLTSSNALDWLDVLEKTLSDITQAYGNTQVAPPSEQTLRANEAIENLYTLLRSNLSGALIQHDVHTALARTYRGCGELEQRKLDSIGESGMKGSGLQIPAVSVQDDPDVDEHGNILSLAAGALAIFTLLPTAVAISTLNVFNISLRLGQAPIEVTIKDVRDFFDRYESMLYERVSAADARQKEMAVEKLEDVKRLLNLQVHATEHQKKDEIASQYYKIPLGSIHPEATLMDLARTYGQGGAPAVSFESDIELDAVLPTTEGHILIGLSRQSCWYCDTLHDQLTESSRGSGVNPVAFVLPGSHSLILPWLPPPELPEDVSLNMRETLLQKLDSRIYVPMQIRGYESMHTPGRFLSDREQAAIFGDSPWQVVKEGERV
ncbi:hypothetical protein ACG7TL_008580 [Trametes sanguinea]